MGTHKKYQRNLILLILFISALSFDSCEVIGGIFKAGYAFGIISIVIIIAVVIWVFSLFNQKNT